MIETQGLARSFKVRGKPAVEAVRGIDVSVDDGELVGFLGPNGAGKTTSMRMLTTLLAPTSGSATVVGHDLIDEQAKVRRSIGYVQQGTSTERLLSVREELVDQAEMYGISRAEGRSRAQELMRQLDLTGLAERRVQTLSGGQRRRLETALGLVHAPPLLFLDEPTTGLDPQSRANMWEHVRGLRERLGTTMFLTTHYLDEADALCDRILIIDHGTVIAEGTPDQLKRSLGGDQLTVDVEGEPADAARAVEAVVTAREVVTSGSVLRLTVEHGDRAIADVIRALDAASIGLRSIGLARPSLDDVFLTLTGRSLREEGETESATAA
ncbi:MAG TPA: ATP-binding cassette domain-containing protein [Solirubrobacteraceae bacterium]|nr:ATP-binding cassette domain-containing protein [Solirubrobacteraceae bacterium]